MSFGATTTPNGLSAGVPLVDAGDSAKRERTAASDTRCGGTASSRLSWDFEEVKSGFDGAGTDVWTDG